MDVHHDRLVLVDAAVFADIETEKSILRQHGLGMPLLVAHNVGRRGLLGAHCLIELISPSVCC